MNCRNIAYKTLPQYDIFKGKNSNFFKDAIKETIFCKRCNKKFVEYSFAKRKYCSKKCADKDKSIIYVGKNHPNWKGSTKNSAGYVLIHEGKQHPFATDAGYVPEHRLVMEKHLGRFLTMEEVVHHKNGKRDDNRIENLQLFENHFIHMKVAHTDHKKYLTYNKIKSSESLLSLK